MNDMIEYGSQLQAIVSAVTETLLLPPDRDMAETQLKRQRPGPVFWLAVEHVMELAHAAQRAEVLKRERAFQEPVTVGTELADKVQQRAERHAAGRCCPRSVGEPSPTCCQYCSESCS
jgi:hypothetical protein